MKHTDTTHTDTTHTDMTEQKQVTKIVKGKELTGTYVDENTIYIKGLGTVKKSGELDLKNFIKDAMSLPSFWR